MLKKIALISGFDGVLKIGGFLLIPIYLAWMPKEEFGEFGYLYTSISMLPPILSLGLYVPQIKESSSSKDDVFRKTVFATTFLTITILLIAIVMLLSLTRIYSEILPLIFGVHKNIEFKWLASSTILVFFTLNLILYSQAFVFQKADIIVKYNGIKFFLVNGMSLAVLNIGLGFSDTSLDRLVGAAIGEILLCGVTFFWFARNYWEWRIDFSYLNKALKLGIPIVPASIAALLTAMSDRYFIAAYYDASYLAEYNLALQFLTPFQMIMMGVQTVWAPHVFSLEEAGNAHAQSINFARKLSLVFIGIVPLLILLVAIAKSMKVIPPSYVDTIWLIPALAFPMTGMILLQIPFNLFVRSGKTSWISYTSIMGALLTILGGILVIPRSGYFGGAISGGVINAFLLFVAWRWAKKTI